MTFLDPTTGLMAAAAAVPALLLVYFLRLRRREVRVSSTLLWDQAAMDLQANVPLRWIRPSLLLLLQLLALAALLAALARPAVPDANSVGRAETVVIVLDRSASMSAAVTGREDAGAKPGEGPVTRLMLAKKAAIEAVRSAARGIGKDGESARIMVIAAAGEGGGESGGTAGAGGGARVVSPFSSRAADAIEAIEALEPSDMPGDAAAGLDLLASMPGEGASAGMQERERAAPSTLVLVMTDTPLKRRPADLPPGTDVRTVLVPSAEKSSAGDGTTAVSAGGGNTGIVAFSVARDQQDPELIRVFARVERSPATAGAGGASADVRCMLNGELVGLKRVELAGAKGADAALGGIVSFQARSSLAGTVVVSLVQPDAMASDDATAATIGPATSAAILLVAPESAEKPGEAQADPFLLSALEITRPRELRVVTSRRAAEMLAQDPRLVNLVVFDRVTPGGDGMPLPMQPSLSFGAGVPVPGLSLEPVEGEAAKGSSRVSSWRRTHPLMRYVGLDRLLMAPRPAAIATGIAKTAAGSEIAANVVVLATAPVRGVEGAAPTEGAIIAALEEPGIGVRRIVVSFALSRSTWGPDTSFPVFITNAVDLLTGRGEAATGRAFETTQAILVHPVAGSEAVEADGPVRLVRAVAKGAETVSMGVLERVGIYRLRGSDEDSVCVNLLSPEETRAAGVSAAKMEDEAGSAEEAAAEGGDGAGGKQREGVREVWMWFVLAAIGLSTAEWVLYARQARA